MSSSSIKHLPFYGVDIFHFKLEEAAHILSLKHVPHLLSLPANVLYRQLKECGNKPHATNLWKSLATRLGVDPSKIHHVPHPIQTDIFKLDPTIQKKNLIISAGRWESYQKTFRC